VFVSRGKLTFYLLSTSRKKINKQKRKGRDLYTAIKINAVKPGNVINEILIFLMFNLFN